MPGFRAFAPALLIPVLAWTACADPAGPPIPAAELELELLGIFEQVWPGPAEGWVEMAVAIGDAVPEAEAARIASLAVTWPIRAVVLDIPPDFVEGPDGRLRASRTVPRDTGLGRGVYFLDVAFDDGATLRLETPHYTGTLQAPQILEFGVSGNEMVLRYRTPPQPHTWAIRIRRADGALLDEWTGTAGSVPASFAVSVDVGAEALEIEVEMRDPRTLRRLIFPVPAAS